MRITRQPTSAPAAPEWFAGGVWMEHVATPGRAQMVKVNFAPGARTAWHTHPLGQTLHITDGAGRVQREGGPVEPVRAGDSVCFEPGERHWHGAAPDSCMAHIAVHEADESGATVDWAEHVSDVEYDA